MSHHLQAIDPQLSATVAASAGTGKTWLLVSRLVRLLLNGARPERILAVTFTRKAAAEMQVRLNSRLRDMAQCSSQQLDQYLTEIGCPLTPAYQQQARTLYETLLSSPLGIKTTTFHAFCQDILQRFPLEAGIPPGFELLASEAEFRLAAWDALCATASRHPESPQATAIETLFDSCGGLDNTRTALNSFLNHRSDWWAFTEAETDPLAFAKQRLAGLLETDQNEDPYADFFSTNLLTQLTEFTDLLRLHSNSKNQKALDALVIARDGGKEHAQRFDAVCNAFLTQKGDPLARKESKAQAKSMGEAGQARFLELHQHICAAIARTKNRLAAQLTLKRSSAWYEAGLALLNHYQALKAEQRMLDFADLEWQAYRLLNHSGNVHWIQYKLDQRIDHLLVDEFQDTNPTQWRLILPLLQELAAGEDERGRTVFLVGDNKQSIYGFRRADPELFATAQSWLKENLNSYSQPLDTSWRSAQAIMDFVNALFGEGRLHTLLTDFKTHQTHRRTLYGRVELLPLVDATDEIDLDQLIINETLRNPLQTPRRLRQDQRHLQEGRLIADKIEALVNGQTPIGPEGEARAMRYSDVLILLRHRTHIHAYEQALREAGIPYNSANRGTLLESQEARDLVDLLQLLIAPYNNITLAGLLRSPLFACSHEDLIRLATQAGSHWIERLAQLAETDPEDSPLKRANRLLNQWRGLVDSLPVHDLLDKIYDQGDVINRYLSAYPRHLRHRAQANLTRFTELALEVDSGRYPTIGRFVARLHAMRQQTQDAPDEGTTAQLEARVNIMTIHGSKGLEAPVVFLADSINTGQGKKAYQAMVHWPTESQRPEAFLLAGKKDQVDEKSAAIQNHQQHREEAENANLLYVAVTRARQYLYISGSQPGRGEQLGWYGDAQYCLRHATENDQQTLSLSSGQMPTSLMETSREPLESIPVHPALGQVLQFENQVENLSPSQTTGELKNAPSTNALESDQQTRGIIIHRMLELLCQDKQRSELLQQIHCEQGLLSTPEELETWFEEAESAFRDQDLQIIFKPGNLQQSFNEVPIHFQQGKRRVYGLIDRVIVLENEIWAIDYKTHQLDSKTSQMKDMLEKYRPQIQLYCEGLSRIWPDKIIRGKLLFTHSRQLVNVELDL